MKKFAKILLFSFFIIAFFSLAFGQEMTAKQKEVIENIKQKESAEETKRKEIEEALGLNKSEEKQKKSQDEINIPKVLTQNRKISDYLNGDSVGCGYVSPPYKCDFHKLRSFVWKNWTEKKLAYFAWSSCSRDYCYTEHYFIEPNKKNEWVIVSFNEHSQKQKIEKLTKAYTVDWSNEKGENVLVLKDKKGNIIKRL